MASPDPKRSLVVTIGASRFPKAPLLSGGSPFSRSVEAFLAYLCAETGFGLHRSNVLDLFDDTRPATEQLEEIAQFLQDKQRTDTAVPLPENLLIYYVGHGLFTPNDRKYCLALRCTNGNNIGLSAMRGRDLGEVVRNGATHLRRFLILDCCFAGSMLGEFLSAPGEAANVQMMEDLPPKGTTLLCASSSQDVALAPEKLEYTMFSDALLKALWKGNSTFGERLSISELKETLQWRLKTDYPSNWVRPEVHSPDMRLGDISSIPLFPNPAWSSPQELAAKEAERTKAEEAQRLRLEQERVEAERVKAAETERVLLEQQKAEAERIRAEKAAQRRLARQKEAEKLKAAEAERLRLEKENAEAERIQAEKAEVTRLAREGAEAERIQAATAERVRLEHEQAAPAEKEVEESKSAVPAFLEQAQSTDTKPAHAEGSRKVVGVTLLMVGICIVFIIIARSTSHVPTESPSPPQYQQPDNSPDSMYERGRQYQYHDPKQAAEWYRKAADAGNANAMTALGWLYDNGMGVEKDLKQAADWYRKGADAGNALGMNNLGVDYENGIGVEKDPKQAADWYRKAADAGYLDAMTNLGLLYENGTGVAKDPKQAADWYRKAADAGNASGMRNLGLAYRNGTGVDKDPKQAAVWIRKSADAGDTFGMSYLGWLYDSGIGVEKDPKQANEWYRKAADAGNAWGMRNLGVSYRDGSGVDKDPKQAADWLRKAADGGDALGMIYLGALYETGTGVDKDPQQAIALYRKAAAMGNVDAKANLKRLGQRP
jgi:TPR repeat protein